MRLVLLSILLISLCSCAPRQPAKVDEIGAKPHRTYSKSHARHPLNDKQQTTHTVVKGDSLYSIGFRYQKDYQTLAAINNIKPPYRIYPKQIIKLTGNPKKVVFKPSNNSQVAQTSPITSGQAISAKIEPIKDSSVQSKPTTAVKQPPQSTAQVTTEPVTKPVTKPPVKSSPDVKSTNNKPMVVATPNNTNLKWLWPTNGKIRTTFLASSPARKGISIGGKEGQAVKAAEAGVVVYSGNGLLGYGELIIIKHNDEYLSAYGHNKTLKAKEGQTVQRGETIAELGSTGTNVNNLHFEIRKNGKPVNPLNYVKP